MPGVDGGFGCTDATRALAIAIPRCMSGGKSCTLMAFHGSSMLVSRCLPLALADGVVGWESSAARDDGGVIRAIRFARNSF